jgi:3-deoxy-manno-octulosonate cytidylyltransferase (CMP-KDO synthetase)
MIGFGILIAIFVLTVTHILMIVLGIIPSRFASTRFPGKPLADIAGKPMIQWVYQRASQVFENLYVATDDERIVKTVEKFGGKVLMTSSDHASGTDRCAEAMELAQQDLGISFDVVVNIQGDEPFIEPNQLKLILKPFNDQNTQIATLVKPFGKKDDIFNPNTPKVVIGAQKQALYFSRSAIPFIRGVEKDSWINAHPFFKHVGLYAYRSHILREIKNLDQSTLELAESLEQLRWLEKGYNIQVEITHQETLSIDTPDDLVRANAVAGNYL